jgi:hypothetical protein
VVAYIKQTKERFCGGCKEHASYAENRRENLNYAKHVLEIGHKYGPMQEVMDILKIKKDHL